MMYWDVVAPLGGVRRVCGRAAWAVRRAGDDSWTTDSILFDNRLYYTFFLPPYDYAIYSSIYGMLHRSSRPLGALRWKEGLC
jgi:hypothetical protein